MAKNNIRFIDNLKVGAYRVLTSGYTGSVDEFMVTASAVGNIITFTKGDGSTFGVTIDTGSGALTPTGSLLLTASVSLNTITFTQGDGSTFPITVDTGSIDLSNYIQSNQTGSFTLTSSFNTFTSSYTTGSFTGSFTGDGSGLTGVVDSTDTGSFVTTASSTLNEITFTKGDGSTFPITVDTGSVDLSGYVQTDQTGSFTLTSSFNSFTSSYSTGSFTGSFVGDGSSLTGIVDTTDTGSLLLTASSNLNEITFTKGDGSTFPITIDTGSVDLSGYVQTDQTGSFTLTSSFNNFTSSYSTGSFTGSFVGDGSGLTGVVDSTDTGSFVTTASATLNEITFTKGDGSTFPVTIDTGSVDLSNYIQSDQTGSFTLTSSFNSFTSSYSTGSFTGSFIGDGSGLTGIVNTTNTGSLLLTASANLNEITFTKGDGSTFPITVDTGSGTLTDTGSLLLTASATLNEITFTKGDGTTFPITVDTGSTDLSNYIQSNQTGSFALTSSLNSFTSSYNTGSFTGSFTGDGSGLTGIGGAIDTGSLLTTASVTLNEITFTKGDGSTFPVIIDTGSVDLTNYIQSTQTGSFTQTSSFNTFTSSYTTGSFTGSFTGDGSGLTGIGGSVDTGSLLLTASSTLNEITFTKGDGSTFPITIDTGSGTLTDTGSLLLTASVTLNEITFTKGDGSTFPITIDTGSTTDISSLNEFSASILIFTQSYTIDSSSFSSSIADLNSFSSSATNTFLNLDQTIPQIVVSGSPNFSGGLQTPNILFDINYTPQGTEPEGSFYWNPTDNTLDLVTSGATLQLGQELYIRAKNTSGVTIPDGSCVYISGHTGVFPDINLAQGNTEITGRVLGVATETFLNNSFGMVTTHGYVRGIKTNYTGSGSWGTTWVEGDNLYLSVSTPGILTNIKPPAPNHSDLVATVGALHPSLGTILVLIQKHITVEELSDVSEDPLTTTGQIITWNNSSSKFNITNNINSYLLSSSYQLDSSSFSSSINNLEIFSSSFNFLTPNITSSLLSTASVSSNTITFTKGDGSTFPITVDTGSGTINNNYYSSIGPPQLFNPDAGSVISGTEDFTLSSINEVAFVTLNGQVLYDSEYGLVSNTLTVTPDNGFYAITDEVLAFQIVFSFSASAGFTYPYTIKSSDYTLTKLDSNVEVITENTVITLYNAIGIGGQPFVIDNSSTGSITVNTSGSQLIIGGGVSTTSWTLLPGEVLEVISNNSNYKLR